MSYLWLTGRRILREDGSETPLTDEGCILLAVLSMSPWHRWWFLHRLPSGYLELWDRIRRDEFGHLSADVGKVRVLP